MSAPLQNAFLSLQDDKQPHVMDPYPRKYFNILIVQFNQYDGNVVVHIFNWKVFLLLVMNFMQKCFRTEIKFFSPKKFTMCIMYIFVSSNSKFYLQIFCDDSDLLKRFLMTNF